MIRDLLRAQEYGKERERVREGVSVKSDVELQAEQLDVLPLRLETITIRTGSVSQVSNIHQSNFSNQIGGDCFKASCDQVNVQSNTAVVHQDSDQRITVRHFVEHRHRILWWLHK